MAINYDPDHRPHISQEIREDALKLGLFPVQILCDDPDSVEGDALGVSFVAFVNAIPREGDLIALEDQTVCKVTRITHVVTPCDFPEFNERHYSLNANVRAVALGKRQT